MADGLALMGVILLASLAGFSPIPELGFVLQVTGLGTAAGTAFAYYLDRKGADDDQWRRTIAGFTIGAFALGVLLVLGDAIGSIL